VTKTLEKLKAGLDVIPSDVVWYLSDLGVFLGRQQLFYAQSPQKLESLRNHALVESAVSSNRIEGIEVDGRRAGTLVFGNAPAANRDEEEVRGYRRALGWIHTDAGRIDFSQATIQKLHGLARGEIWDAGRYKDRDGDIVERYENGETRVRFRTVSASRTPESMSALVRLWQESTGERRIPGLIGLAATNLDFLCIHPFRDGNGRVSRLIWLLQCYHLGYEVGRFISLERIIEQNRDRYYETLEQSSHGWHEGTHDPWPYIRFVLFVLKEAYREFETRVNLMAEPRGAKTAKVISVISQEPGTFTVSHLRAECPGVSVDMIRRILKDLQKEGKVRCQGRGRGARWIRTG